MHSPKRLGRLAVVAVACLLMVASSLHAASPAGRWQGGWYSAPTGHRGPLRARIRPLNTNQYQATFAGRFALVVPFVYRARLDRVPGTVDQYTSSKRMPFVGNYQMHATITPDHFHADFRGRRDSGTFRMMRRGY